MPDCTLAANACAAVCTLLVLGVAFMCCVRWPFGFGGSDLSVTGECFSCYGGAFFMLRGSVLLVTGERFSCYGRAFFLLREADFSVGRIDFSISRKCFSAFAQVHLSPLTSVFMYSCRWFYVLLQAHHVLCMSSWRVCKQGFSPAPPCPVVAPCGDAVRCQKSGIEICMSEFLYRLLKGFVLYVGYSLGVS
jgi:hypothetical protein